MLMIRSPSPIMGSWYLQNSVLYFQTINMTPSCFQECPLTPWSKLKQGFSFPCAPSCLGLVLLFTSVSSTPIFRCCAFLFCSFI